MTRTIRPSDFCLICAFSLGKKKSHDHPLLIIRILAPVERRNRMKWPIIYRPSDIRFLTVLASVPKPNTETSPTHAQRPQICAKPANQFLISKRNVHNVSQVQLIEKDNPNYETKNRNFAPRERNSNRRGNPECPPWRTKSADNRKHLGAAHPTGGQRSKRSREVRHDPRRKHPPS